MTGRERALAALDGRSACAVARYADLAHPGLVRSLGGPGEELEAQVRALRALGVDMSRWPSRVPGLRPESVRSLPVAETLSLVRDSWKRAVDAAGDELLVLLEFPYSILGPVLAAPNAMEALAELGSSPSGAAALLDPPARLCLELAEGIAAWGEVTAALFMDDLAGNGGPLISPSTLRALYFPRLREVFAALAAGGVRAIFHSDGDLGAIHRDIILAGAAGHHPVEPVGGWSLDRAADSPVTVLVGNGDLGKIGASAPSAAAEGRRCRSFGQRHAAYFLAPAAEVMDSTPAENWIEFFAPDSA